MRWANAEANSGSSEPQGHWHTVAAAAAERGPEKAPERRIAAVLERGVPKLQRLIYRDFSSRSGAFCCSGAQTWLSRCQGPQACQQEERHVGIVAFGSA